MKRSVAILLAGLVAGCTAQDNPFASDAERALEKSRIDYKNCLAENSQKPSTCEGARLAFEADLQVYRAESARNAAALQILNAESPAVPNAVLFSPGVDIPNCPGGYHPEPDGRGNMLCVP